MAIERKCSAFMTVNGAQIGGSVILQSSAAISISEPIASDAVNYAVNVGLNCATCKALFLMCDTQVEIKANATSGEEATLGLAPNVPYLWFQGSGLPLAWGSDVLTAVLTNDELTTIYVSEEDGEDGTLILEALYDSSP